MTARIVEAGDTALVVELDARIDVEVNARAVALAEWVQAARLPGVLDIVPTFRTVAVYFDPLEVDLPRLRSLLEERGQMGVRHVSDPHLTPAVEHVISVQYGGAEGPDLADVAHAAGISEDEVVARHTAPSYRVFMLGFLPGFAYMGPLDSTLARPRRATPRARVPTGSVAIAGRLTGIYPMESPGGWHIIGRTASALFDVQSRPPALLKAGDAVRFSIG